jgi:hypothetical protein
MTVPHTRRPTPPLVFTVAITGHQDIHQGRHKAIKELVSAILQDAGKQLAKAKAASFLDAPRDLHLRFISALAPGADQIGAEAALWAEGWALNAILPFDCETFQALARTTLEQRDEEKKKDNNPAAVLGKKEIDKAIAKIATLAEGADRVLELADWQPTSLSTAETEADWQSRRYATIGQMLVRQADLLIALWDGKPPRGRGGTADVVSEARRSGVPVIWIDPASPGTARSLVPDPASGHIPASDIVVRHKGKDSRVLHLITDGPEPAISAAIAQVLLGNDPERAICIERYHNEPTPELWMEKGATGDRQPGDRHWAYAFMLYTFLNWPTRLKRRLSAEERAQGKAPKDLRGYPFGKARPAGGGRARKVLLYPFGFGVERDAPGTTNAAPLLDHAARADALATRLSNQYRSAYVMIFALAPVAVMWAVISALMLKELGEYKHWMVVLELITVGTAASIYLRTRASDPVAEKGHRPGWLRRMFPRSQDTHQRWLDARLIAESQRSGQLLAWVGFSGRRPIDPAATGHDPHDHQDDGHGHAAPRTVWAPHYANAVAALPELPHNVANDDKLVAMNPLRVAALAEAAGKVIADQLGYHDLNHQRLEALNHRLDTFSLRAIQIAAAISFAYLVIVALKETALAAAPSAAQLIYGVYDLFKYGAAFTGAVLPALAAAAAGIRFQGDFERFAMRSKDTASRLKILAERAARIKARAEQCGTAACPGQPPLFEPLLDLLLDTQAILDEDLADWRFAYAARPITFG